MSKVLVKTDKNGTQYFHHVEKCGKCGGSGYIGHYHFNQAGLCFDCWGSGTVEFDTKEYTPEYEAKLIEKREKAQERKIAKAKEGADERNAEFFAKHGFNQQGKTYVAIGNTYPIKDMLKEQGCKWLNTVGWISPQPIEGVDMVELDVEDIYYKDYTDSYKWNNFKSNADEGYTRKIKEAELALAPKNAGSHFGEVGKRYEMELTLERSISWEQSFGYRTEMHYRHIFRDADGNIFTWKTTNLLWYTGDDDHYKTAKSGQAVILKGTVKEHSVYDGVNQTELTRCTIKGLA